MVAPWAFNRHLTASRLVKWRFPRHLTASRLSRGVQAVMYCFVNKPGRLEQVVDLVKNVVQ